MAGRKTNRLMAAVLAVLMACAMVLAFAPRKALAEDGGSTAPTNVHFEFDGNADGLVTKAYACWDPVPGVEGHYVMVYLDGQNYSSSIEVPTGSAGDGRLDITDELNLWGGEFTFGVWTYDHGAWGDEAHSAPVSLCLLTIATSMHGDEVTICAKQGSQFGPLIEAAYLPTLTNEGGAYHHDDIDGNPDTLVAVVPDWVGSYATRQDLLDAACWPAGGTGYTSTIDADLVVSTAWESDFCPSDGNPHAWAETVEKATLTTDGGVYMQCAKCGRKEFVTPLARVTMFELSASSFTYDGTAKKPTVQVRNAFGDILDPATEYTLSYKNNVNAGTATVTVALNGRYYSGTKALTYKITQAGNAAKAAKTTVKKTVKRAKVKKKAQKIALPKVTSTFGTAKWKVSKKDKKKVLSLKSGKVVVKKGAKKGTYTIKLKASVPATANYKGAATKVVTVKVTVK